MASHPLSSWKTVARPVRQHLVVPLYSGFQGLTSLLRIDSPDFLIIGAQKAGTTALFKYLAMHPGVAPSFPKEVHYYNKFYCKGPHWYRKHFPTNLYRWTSERIYARRVLTGEATPSYLLHPHAPRRISKDVPHARIIVMLRNPVARAFSHYQHETRHQSRESLPFSEAVRTEEERIGEDWRRLLSDEDSLFPDNISWHSYKLRGHYYEQVKRWFDHFDRSQFLILNSEEFMQDTASGYKQVLDFLALRDLGIPAEFPKKHVGGYKSQMDEDTKMYLNEYFKPHNQRLYELLGRDFGW